MNSPGDMDSKLNRVQSLIQTQSDSETKSSNSRLDSRHLLLFSMLYAVQGVVVSYFLTFNGRYMSSEIHTASLSEQPLSISQIGWSQSIATLPLAVKFVFGVLADRFSFFGFGHRKPYILLGLLLQSISLLALSQINPVGQLEFFTLTATLAVIGLCLYDVACDAFAVQITPVNDRNRVQGVLQASRFVSTAICGVLFGLLWKVTAIPGNGVLWLCGILTLPAIVYSFSIPEPEKINNGGGFAWQSLRIFRNVSLWALLFFSVIYSLVSFGVESVLVFWFAVPFLAFSEKALGFQSLGRNLGRAVGAILQSKLSTRTPRRILLALGLTGLSLSSILFSMILGHYTALFVGVIFGISVGWLDALACSMAMDEADEYWPATSYALIMAFQNLGTLGSGILASLAQSIGFKNAFLLVAAINLIAVTAVFGMPKAQRKVTEPDIWSV